MNKRLKITFVAVAVLVAATAAGIGLSLSSNGSDAMADHLTVTQAKTDGTGQAIKVGGDVVPGSVDWDYETRSLRFTLSGDGDEISVFYEGVAPNDFEPGAPLLVEGTYSADGGFRATSLATTTSPFCKACHG